MTQDTKNIFASLLNSANKSNQTKQAEIKNEVIVPIEIKKDIAPAKMQSFQIVWHEGTGNFDGKILNTWKEADEVLNNIFSGHTGDGYTKVKVCIKWVNGKEITDRIDLGWNGCDFCPLNGSVGDYLKKQNSCMYAGNLILGERNLLSFEDEETKEDAVKPIIQKPTVSDIFPEIKTNLKLVDYSDKAFAIIGETKPIKEQLRQLGGKFNYYLSCGAGWIFPKTKAYTVRKALNLI